MIKTIMQAGSWEQIQWAGRTYGRERFERVLREDLDGNRELARPVANFWSIVLWGKPLPPIRKEERWQPTRKIAEV
ncbi:MAG: hypothetical protein IRY95_08755 [Clostridia bacterium]|nr:hypothetical protein [Clostridia bacterium]